MTTTTPMTAYRTVTATNVMQPPVEAKPGCRAASVQFLMKHGVTPERAYQAYCDASVSIHGDFRRADMIHDKIQRQRNEIGQQAHALSRINAEKRALHQDVMAQRAEIERAVAALDAKDTKAARSILAGVLAYRQARVVPRVGA